MNAYAQERQNIVLPERKRASEESVYLLARRARARGKGRTLHCIETRLIVVYVLSRLRRDPPDWITVKEYPQSAPPAAASKMSPWTSRGSLDQDMGGSDGGRARLSRGEVDELREEDWTERTSESSRGRARGT